jgi:hypothetical protein
MAGSAIIPKGMFIGVITSKTIQTTDPPNNKETDVMI